MYYHPSYPTPCHFDNASWEDLVEDYEPVPFFHPGIKELPNADPAIDEHVDLSERITYANGQRERLGATSWYWGMGHLPLNPGGRRGISDRGILAHWGPNHTTHVVILTYGTLDQGRGYYMWTHVTNQGSWSIPEMLDVIPGSETSGETGLGLKVYQNAPLASILIDASLKYGAFESAHHVPDDERNTDHAWIEMKVSPFYIPLMAARCIPTSMGNDGTMFKWLRVSDVHGNAIGDKIGYDVPHKKYTDDAVCRVHERFESVWWAISFILFILVFTVILSF